jgi:hypothetical protein
MELTFGSTSSRSGAEVIEVRFVGFGAGTEGARASSASGIADRASAAVWSQQTLAAFHATTPNR